MKTNEEIMASYILSNTDVYQRVMNILKPLLGEYGYVYEYTSEGVVKTCKTYEDKEIVMLYLIAELTDIKYRLNNRYDDDLAYDSSALQRHIKALQESM